MLHYRSKFLAEFNSQFVKAFLRLVKPCLHRIVLHIELFRYWSGLLESLVSFLLLPTHSIDIAGESRDNSRCSCSLFSHILKYRSEDIHATEFMQSVKQHQKSLVSGTFQSSLELFKVKTCCLCDFVCFLKQVHDKLWQCRSRHFHCLALRVKHSCKCHKLWDRHASLRSHTGKSLRELGEVRSRRRAVLRQLIDNRADSEQRAFRSESCFIAENVCKFRECKRRTIAEVIESHIYLVGRFHEPKHIFLWGFTKATGFLREPIKILTRSTSINLLKLLVQECHLFGSHTCKLTDICHFSVHFGIGIHGRATSHNHTGNSCGTGCKRSLPIVHFSVEPFPKGFTVTQFPVYLVNLSPYLLDVFRLAFPSLRASFKVVKLLFEGFQCSLQFLRSRLVKLLQHSFHLHSCRLHFTDLSLRSLQFLTQFSEFRFVTSLSCFSDSVFKIESAISQFFEHLFRLLAVHRQIYWRISCVITHSILIKILVKIRLKIWLHKRQIYREITRIFKHRFLQKFTHCKGLKKLIGSYRAN